VRTLILGALLASAGCFDRPTPACAFECGPGGDCPDDYSCAPDGLCKRSDVDPELDCPGLNDRIDAGPDAAATDAD